MQLLLECGLLALQLLLCVNLVPSCEWVEADSTQGRTDCHWPYNLDHHRDLSDIMISEGKDGMLKNTVASMVGNFQQSWQNCDPCPLSSGQIQKLRVSSLSGNGGLGNSCIFHAFSGHSSIQS
jgi:hypothetical protein